METYRGTVNQWELDHMGHMNVRFYVAKFDEGTWQLFGALGLTPEWLRSHSRGMAAVEQNIWYLTELTGGDLISIESRVLDVTAKAVRFRHEMIATATGEQAAATELVAVHIDTQARRAVPLPAFVRVRAAELGTS